MPIDIENLVQPFTADEVEGIIIDTLQGVGPIQQIGSGAGSITVSGAPLGNYDVQIIITTGGNPGTAAFTYSLDGGQSVNGPQLVPSSGTYSVAGSGMTLQFSGAFGALDKYLWQTIFPQFPVTSWESGDIGTTWIKSQGQVIADLAGNTFAAIAGSGFVDLAVDEGTLTDPLALLSDQAYNNPRFTAQVLQGQVVLSLSANAPAINKSAGELIVANALGAGPTIVTYTNSSSINMSPGTSLVIPVQASSPGAKYNVSNGVLTTLQTPAPGLSVNNPAPGTSAVTPLGPLTVSGSPNGNYNVVVRVLSTGALSIAAAQVSLDGGQNFASPFTIPLSGTYTLNQLNSPSPTGLVLHFAAGTWTSGDNYSFSAYASWILTPGQDIEPGQALRTRDKSRWGTLGLGGGSAAAYDFLVRATPNGGSEVVDVSAVPDGAVGGQIDVVVAGQNGAVSTTALANIQAFLNARAGLTDVPIVASAQITTVNVTGTAYVIASQLAAAQAAISTALDNYRASVGIAGLVEWVAIAAAVINQRPSGVTNYAPLSPLADVQLATGHIVQFNVSITYVLV